MAPPAAPVVLFLIRRKGEISFFSAVTGLAGVAMCQRLFPELVPPLMIVLQHGFEAATVGGAADWLAVKMIFDEIKIAGIRIVPASGIIPRKQKIIARGAGELVAREWLSAESIARALREFDFAKSLADYVTRSSDLIDRQIDRLLRTSADWLNDPENANRLSDWFASKAQNLRLSGFLAKVVDSGSLTRVVHDLVPPVAEALRQGLASPEVYRIVLQKMQEEQKGFFRQLFFDPEEAAEKALLKGMEFLRELQEREDHPVRLRLIEAAQQWLGAVQREPEKPTRLDEAVQELIGDSDRFSRSIVSTIRESIEGQERNPASGLRQWLKQMANDAIDKLRSDWSTAFNDRIRTLIGDVMARHHDRIAAIVEDNLNRLSPEQIKTQFKQRTYDDMQWIRVNGAVAGFVIGIVLGLVRMLL